MKVLQINSVCGIGSTGRIATDIHKVLIEQGHESYIAYGRGLPKNCDNAIRIGSKFGIYAHVAKTRIFDKHGFGSKKATREFIKKIKEINPDIIHLHNIHGYYINIEILFKYLKKAKKPVVWTLHDCWSFTGHCTHFDYSGCHRWKTGCYNCPEKKTYPRSLMLDNSRNNFLRKKRTFTGVDNLTIITPSEWLYDLVKESYLKEYPSRVINNGIDLNVFKPMKGNFRNKYDLNSKFVILGVANIWNRRKGLDAFIELADKLADDEKIVLVGLSEKQIKNLTSKIIGIPRTDNIEELVDIYTASDVYFCPSLEETYGMTTIEALACGTPVVTYGAGGNKEIILKKYGRVVEIGNASEALNAIRNLKGTMNVNGINLDCVYRANKLFALNTYCNSIIDVYAETERANDNE